MSTSPFASPQAAGGRRRPRARVHGSQPPACCSWPSPDASHLRRRLPLPLPWGSSSPDIGFTGSAARRLRSTTSPRTYPPPFVAALSLHTEAVNSPQYIRQAHGSGGRIIGVPTLLRRYFPDVRPLHPSLSPAQAL